MICFKKSLRSFLAAATLSLSFLESHASSLPREIWPFLETHCVECHDEVTLEGGLDLYALADEITAGDALTWTHLFDRVDQGEMPPPERPRPGEQEIAEFLGALAAPLAEADRSQREIVMRRLNRVEYENTVRDLLGVETDLIPFLPEDQSLGGFDTNGSALAVSAEQFESWLTAARAALDDAIFHEERPLTETVTVDSLREVGPYLGKQYAKHGDMISVHMRNKTNYSKISTRGHRTPQAGRYRFSFSVKTVHADKPLVFSVTASDFKKTGPTYRSLGFHEASAEAREVVIDTWLEQGFAIQFFAHGLPFYVKDPAQGEHAGIAFGPVSITGPIYETWPPESHQRLLGKKHPRELETDEVPRILQSFMERAWRRPVEEAEVQSKVGLFRKKQEAGASVFDSLRVSLEAVLCSPHFLYFQDQGEELVNDHMFAERLSYFLWSSSPDQRLREMADQGRLSDAVALKAEVERMLDSGKAERFVKHFTGQWLKLREINATVPDRKLYSQFDEVLQHSMVRESELFFKTVLEENMNLSSFLDSSFLVINERLAEHYDIEGVSGFEFQRVSLPESSSRGGVLTQAAVLKVTANGTNTSPVMRGIWVLENILGKHVSPPPPGIAGIEPDIRSATTVREQLALHSQDQSCAGCHQYIDPPGFALESFDPTGAFRDHYLQFKPHAEHPEKGWGTVVKAKAVDSSGKLSTGESFDSIEQFKALLFKDEKKFALTLTERLATYALGRELGFSDREALAEIVESTATDGNGFRTLIHHIISHPIFRRP